MNSTRQLLAAAIVAVGSFAFAATAHAQQVKAAPAKDSAKFKAEAKVTEAAARATALKAVPNGVIQSSELERENGKLIYSYDIKVPGKSGIEEVNVDAITGAVVGHEHETPAMEKKEAKPAVKEKKPPKPY